MNGLALLGILPRQASFIVDAVVFGGLITRIASLAIQGGMNGHGGTIRALFNVDVSGFALSIVASFLDRLSSRAT